MEDSKIIDLYWDRDEGAIVQTRSKYGRYCYTIAYNILRSKEEAEESENDTYMAAWNTIPPHRPDSLPAYLGKITRRISLDRWKTKNAQKRGAGQSSLSLDELRDCIPDQTRIDDHLNAENLASAINGFLKTIPKTQCAIFVYRYWYCHSIQEIAKSFGCTQSKVKTSLFRTRQKLRDHLEKEGIFL